MNHELTNLVDLFEKLTFDKFSEIVNELNNKNNNYDNFILNITHDLRSHLNVIISALQYIQHNNEVNEQNNKYINIMKRNSYKMLKLINNLIDTNRLENNYYHLNKKNIDIVSMIEGTVECITKYACEKNITLIFDTNEEECIMAVDPEAVDRIIMNLLSNAIKFSDENSNIFISLTIENENIKISIKDEGKGISKEEKEKIFDRFYQSSTRSTKETIGSGIGLDLTNYLVKSHNGIIELNSELEKGSEFIITLPKYIEDDLKVNENNYSSKILMLEIEFSDIYLG